MTSLTAAFDHLAARRVVLFGGKGGVGKTTIAIAAALQFAESREVILFTTDPASNLQDVFGDARPKRLRIEALDAEGLYRRFLDVHLASFLEIGDRGTYLDREELRRLFELAIPGIDELMAWMHIGELAEENGDAVIVVDTAPTGHTLRMLASADHFRQLAVALDAMEEKHRTLVRQFTRRDVRDAMDAFIDDFDARARRRRELLTDAARAAFVPVVLSEPWVVEQSMRLIAEVRENGIDVPLIALNRAIVDADCARDRERAARDAEARARFAPTPVADAPRACAPLDSPRRIAEWAAEGKARNQKPATRKSSAAAGVERLGEAARCALLFLAGKGGVGKTTCAASVALQRAQAEPQKRFVVISVDPAHSLRDVFAHDAPPPNLVVETIDTRARWKRFRDSIGSEIEGAVQAIAPQGMTVAYDTEAMQQLLEIAPPGADELFAITRLSELIADERLAGIIVDTAPTGHFLRLLELPRTATEWVREFMRLLLRYKELIPPGSLGEELVQASQSLKALEHALHSDDTAVLLVTRPERVVVAETLRLRDTLTARGIRVGATIANYVTPDSDCACDRSMRGYEIDALAPLGEVVRIGRRDTPPVTLAELGAVVPL